MSGEARDFRLLEALLFAASEPLDSETLVERLPPGADVSALIARLTNDYASRGVNLVRIAAVETLAIVAYHQPVTRAEIEEARGVGLSRGTLDILLEAGWIRPKGRRHTPGRPVTWVTTEAFLDNFGLDSLEDLPGVDELRAAGLLEMSQPTLGLPPDATDETEASDEE